MNIDTARLNYLKADDRLGQAQARHRHWKSEITAELLQTAQSEARAAYRTYLSMKKATK